MATFVKTCCLLFAVVAAKDSCPSGDCDVKNEADTSALLQRRVGVDAVETDADDQDLPDHIKEFLASGTDEVPLLQEGDDFSFDFRHTSGMMSEGTKKGVEKIL